MKKDLFFCIAILALFLFTLCSCATDSEVTLTNSHTSPSNINDNISHMPVPAQPISFPTLDHAVMFIQSPNLDEYRAEWHSAYDSMVASFSSYGYMVSVSHKIADRLRDEVTLYPEVKYEDVGLCFWFELDDTHYQVMIYNIKTDEEYHVKSEEDIADYLIKRFSVSENANFEYIETDHQLVPTMLLSRTNGKICVSGLLNESQYIQVIADVDQDTMKSFVQGLQFGKIDLVKKK